jgi:4-aminobutyrate aminotransferase-like enzyme
LQLALMTEGIEADWPGVGDPDEMYLWHGICPNPAALLNLPDKMAHYSPSNKKEILSERREHFGRNLSITYEDPVMLVRGWKHHMFDEWARPYLDAYNNVPHVGHAHPRIQRIVSNQMGRINTNTRYLHPAQTAFSKKILSKFPSKLDTCFFVNSGSEANELALRLVRAHTGLKGIVTLDHGYYGNTTGAVDMSAYKFNAEGGVGQADWVELIDLPDDYRGRFKRDDLKRGKKFADLVNSAISNLMSKQIGLAGFVAETFPSVAGQIIPPEGYLKNIYQHIREAGGLCVADEVQTGLGRLGEYYFGFEQQEVEPDIVVLGKPIGNGYPIGVVITSNEIAESFAQGPEFFSTFGGSTLSCLIGKEVLEIIDEEKLQENADLMGKKLLGGLNELQDSFPQIGDVRGMGLFCGVDLVKNRKTREEDPDLCSYIKNRMRDHRILMGSEGPKDNVLKIRPPLTIDEEGIDMILSCLQKIMQEI